MKSDVLHLHGNVLLSLGLGPALALRHAEQSHDTESSGPIQEHVAHQVSSRAMYTRSAGRRPTCQETSPVTLGGDLQMRMGRFHDDLRTPTPMALRNSLTY